MTAPELKPAGDWASEWLGYNVGPEQKRLVEWIDEIKANAAAHARYQALTEAAKLIDAEHHHSVYRWRIAQEIIALRDAKET